ncbi:hypothetical protein BJ165DRAFT_1516547 [Panaeolus papilionaceus]|nr:hypothetical protein BJ165DRAFT_1516547 [Panaeolus papilionaceus]
MSRIASSVYIILRGSTFTQALMCWHYQVGQTKESQRIAGHGSDYHLSPACPAGSEWCMH